MHEKKQVDRGGRTRAPRHEAGIEYDLKSNRLVDNGSHRAREPRRVLMGNWTAEGKDWGMMCLTIHVFELMARWNAKQMGVWRVESKQESGENKKRRVRVARLIDRSRPETAVSLSITSIYRFRQAVNCLDALDPTIDRVFPCGGSSSWRPRWARFLHDLQDRCPCLFLQRMLRVWILAMSRLE